MRIPERVHAFVVDPADGRIFAAGRKGGVYAISHDLSVERASERIDANDPICTMAIDSDTVYTRDALGRLVAWDKATLLPRAIVASDDSAIDVEEREEDVVFSINHGLAVGDGLVHANNGRGRIVTYTARTLELVGRCDPNEESFTETINVESPARHVLSDFRGFLWKGDLRTGRFERSLRIDTGPSHVVRYDARHDRYWATTDNAGGFALVDAALESFRIVPLTNDDIEWIAFDPSARRAVIGCFDHHVYEFDNTDPEPKLVRVHGPFKYQLRQVAIEADGRILALLQSGEILRIESDGEVRRGTEGFGNACWGIDLSPCETGLAWAAFEDGTVRAFRFGITEAGGSYLREAVAHQHAFGRLRRCVPTTDGGYVAVGTRGVVFRVDASGAVSWKRTFRTRTNDVVLSSDGLSIATGEDDGTVWILDASTGRTLANASVGGAVWALSFDAQGRLFVGDRAFHVTRFEPDLSSPRAVRVGERIKRLKFHESTLVALGPAGVVTIDPDTLAIVFRWQDELQQTCENAVFLDDGVHAIFYDLKYVVYDKSKDVARHVLPRLHDFPLGMVAQRRGERTFVLVGGRGAFLTLLETSDGEPRVLRSAHVGDGKGTLR